MSERRGSRKQRNGAYSDTYFLGYAEDEETPEMIEKKFQAMERLLQEKEKQKQEVLATTQTEDGNKMSKMEIEEEPRDRPYMDDDIAEELFRETSTFTVRQALSRTKDIETFGHMMGEDEERFGSDFVSDEEFFSEHDFWSDDDLDFGKNRTVKRIKVEKEKKEKVQREKNPKKKELRELFGMGGAIQRVRRHKRKPVDGPTFLKVTKEIPQDWAKHIKPYCPIPEYDEKKSISLESNIMMTKFKTLFPKNQFMLCLMDPPWKRKVFPWETDLPDDLNSDPNLIEPEDLKQMDIFDAIKPGGFIVIWTAKAWLGEVNQIFKDKKFDYVENFVWVKRDTDNSLITNPSSLVKSSKETLLMFRKGKDKIELRHQRNPDFVYEFIRDIKTGNSEDKPDFTYTMIETLLPYSTYEEGKGIEGFNLLELWGKKNSYRTNWAKFSQNPEASITAPLQMH